MQTWFHREVWQCAVEIRVTLPAPQPPSTGRAELLLSCPAPTWFLSPHAADAGGQQPCAHGWGRLEGACFSTRDELVSVPTQSLPRTSVEQVWYTWWSPFPGLDHAAGPLPTLLASQRESYVWVGELANDPKMHFFFFKVCLHLLNIFQCSDTACVLISL